MKKRYTSDPKQASRRNAFTNKNFLILLAFLAVCPVAWAWYPPSAGTYYLRSTGTGNNFKVYSEPNGTGTASPEQTQLNGFTISSGTYTLVFENTFPIIMNGRIFIDAAASTEAKLHMQLGTGASADPTLKITGNGGQQHAAFFINNVANTDRTKHVIIIEGNDPSDSSTENISNYVYDFSNNFVIDGDGPVMTAIDNGTSIPQMKVTTAGNRKSYGLFRIQEGTLQLKNVTVQNFATNWANGGVIQVFTGQSNNTALVDVDHCHFKSIASRTEIVLKVQSNGTYNDQPATGLNEGLRDAKFKNCKIEYTFGCDLYDNYLSTGFTKTIGTQNGTFRSIGQNSVTISLENCHLTNNYGCPVRWHGSRSKDKLIVNHCKIENNYTLTGTNVNGGGGLLLKGPAQISQCTIQYNRTNGDGGGIYLSTYTDFGGGTENLVPDHSILELDGQTLIDHNTAAGSGGGVAIDGVRMKNNQSGANYEYPNGPNGYIWYNPDDDPFKLRFVLGGATISNNKALGGAGGGVWINRNEEVTYYKVECELDKGTISGNECSVNGGGVDVITTQNFNNPSVMPNHVHPQDVTVTVSKEGEAANKITIEGNTASNYAGGIYVEAYPVTYNNTTSAVSTTVYDYSEITGNTATSHGGGLYVKRGTVNVTQSGSKQPLIQGNMANTYHGGGIYLDNGEINISGGLVKDNKATAHGGGIYNNNGTISLTNSSEVSGNKAGTYNSGTYGNGGGIYTQTGSVNITNSSVQGNECQKLGGGIYTLSGNITLTNATIGGDKTANEGNQTVHNEGDGGGIYTANGAVNMTNSSVQGNIAKRNGGGVYVANNSVTMRSCTIGGSEAKYGNTATNGSGGGIYVGSGAVRINPEGNYVGTPSNISYNTAQVHGGGMYVANGRVVAYGSFTESTYYPITITYNTATTGSGGGIFCMGNGATTYFDIRLRRVIVSHNKALGTANASSPINLGCGGGMYLDEGKISVISGDISNNEAKVGGGGIYTRVGDIDINGTQDEHTATQITNNTAGLNGGGVNTHSGTVTILGNSPDQRINISGNTATTGSGGGIFCYGTNVNTKYITLLHADLNDNHAAQGGGTQTVLGDAVVSGRGGGMYLQKGIIDVTDVKIQQNTAKLNGGGINNHEGNIDVNGCLIGGGAGLGNMAGYDSSTGQQNTEGSGGGIYTNAGDIDIEDYVETTGGITRIESKITHNTAVLNGGGIDTHSGTIYINRSQMDDQIEISNNTANKGGGLYANEGTIIAYNALINNNTAETNGGGINNHGGNIEIYGGMLSNNMATEGNGGGAYTHVGDVVIKPFNPSNADWLGLTGNDGTKIYNNIAKMNGGGINNHTGTVDLHYATLQNNTATLGNGGGIYCVGPHTSVTGFTIRLLRSTLNQNKTRGQDGTEAAPTGRGGGIYLHYGRIFAQGSKLTLNKANINGGAINNHQGNIRVYGCQIDNNTATTGKGGGIYANEGNIIIGPSGVAGASTINNNFAAKNGGGINNEEGNIEINGDYILGNEAGELGGGVYLALGDITMNGGKVDGNKAGQKGGGVYVGGTESGGTGFTIQERTPKPIVEILEVTPGTTSAVVHYHIVDGGDGSNFAATHGLKWSDDNSPTYDTPTVGDVPGCRKATVTGLTTGTTYTIYAYVTYNGETGKSSHVAFTTYSSSPALATGAASNITATSASASGKLLYKGNNNIQEKNIGIEYSTDKNMTTPTPTQVPVSDATTIFNEGSYFTIDLTGLTANTKYYIRAYAKNDGNQTGVGELDSITTPKNTPNMGDEEVQYTFNAERTEITFSFTMPEALAGNGYKNYGFVLSYDDDPELAADHTINIDEMTTSGNTFSTTVPLTLFYNGPHYPSFYYYARAFATKADGEPAAMDITNYSITAARKFAIPEPEGKPVVRLLSISQITQTSAIVKGQIIYKGSRNITRYGLCWNTDPSTHPTHSGTHIDGASPTSMNDGSEFEITMTPLQKNTTYYLRVYATNTASPTDADYVYGNDFNFTTLPIELPNVIVSSIQNITQTSADVVCHVTDGGGTISDWGVKYSTNSDMTGATDVNKPGTPLSGDSFTAHLPKTGEPDLTAHTKYYVQAYATNSTGTHTCQAVDFMTDDIAKPTVSEVALSYITLPTGGSNQSTISYKVEPAAGTTVQTHGVAWSTLRKPKRQESDVTNTHFEEITSASVTSAQTFEQTRTQAYPNMKYYVRAYASKEDPDANNTLANIVYSDEISFVTLPVVATPEGDDAVSNLTNNSATLKGTIVSRDTEGHLVNNKRGVCWSTTQGSATRTTGFYAEDTITTTSGVSVNYTVDTTNLTAGTTYYYRAYYYRSSDNAITYGEERTFTTKAYGLDITALPVEGGTVNKTHVGLNTSDTCHVKATANAGYTFNYWTFTGGGTSPSISDPATTNPTTFTMGNPGADATLTANFTANTYSLSISVEPTGAGNVTVNETAYSAPVSVTYNTTSVTLEATPATDYQFLYWTVNGNVVSSANPYTFTYNIADNATFVANFESTRGRRSGTQTPRLQNSSNQGTQTSRLQNTPRPRDIYPAPAREPWLWDDDDESTRDGEPTVTTGAVTPTDATTALCSGTVTVIGSSNVTAYGVCWGTTVDPTTSDSHTTVTTDKSEAFSIEPQTMTGLTPNTVYYVRAYATNSQGTSYGASLTFLTTSQNLPLISNNEAEYGGGIYLAKNETKPAKLVFSGGSSTGERGKIMYNYASEAGGGIYIDTTALMHMKGHCEVNANHVPKGKNGGGIYLKGRLYVGETGTSASDNGLIVNQNFAMDGFDETSYSTNPATYTTANKLSLNNVCLTRHTYDYAHSIEDGTYDDESTVIALLSDISGFTFNEAEGHVNGIYEPQYGETGTTSAASSIGFHVTEGFCPVIATSDGFPNAYKKTWKGNGQSGSTYENDHDEEYEKWLQNIMWSSVGTQGLMNGSGAIFEDTESYVAIHTRQPSAPFNSKYIYLWGCWTHPAVMTDPESGSPMSGNTDFKGHYKILNPSDNTNGNDTPLEWEIYSEEGLAWFSSYVNGLNAFKDGDTNGHQQYKATKNPKAKAVLKEDIDLSAHFWVPIGSVTLFNDESIVSGLSGGSGSLFDDQTDAPTPNPHHYKGTFDGNGHTIKGIDCRYLSGIYKLGLFGYLDEGAVVKNVFIDNSRFEASDNAKGFHVGGIAGKMLSTATLSASEARATIDITNADKATSYVGGLVGEAAGANVIHSSMAMPNITGAADYMGGLVGKIGSGNKLYNSFSNPKFPQTTTPWYAMSSGKYIGGLVGENNGVVENCYSRLQGDEPTSNGTASVFGWLAGSNTVAASESSEGGIRFSYIPDGQTVYVKNTIEGSNKAPYGHGTYGPTTRVSGKYGFKHRDQAIVATNVYVTTKTNDTLIGGLQHALNEWVIAKNATTPTYHPWMRSMATAINDDYPIPNFKVWTGSKDVTESPLYNAVGAKDGVFMEYKLDVNDLLKEYVALDKTTYPNPVAYLYNTNLTNITQTNIGTTHDNVTLAINEDVGILQDVNLKARVGVTFDNSKHDASLWGEPYDWHMFSSALNEVAMGLRYHADDPSGYNIWDNYSNYRTNGIPNDIYTNREYMDPPRTYFHQTDSSGRPGYTTNLDDLGYFPANTPYGKWRNKNNEQAATEDGFPSGSFDFYCYGENYYQHWINFKRRGDATFLDHWREDANMDHPTDYPHYNIPYINENKMVNGKGYLMAVSEASMLMADGTLNNGDRTYKATYTEDPEATYYDVMVRGTNLIGNPYQSYLDFDLFAADEGVNNGKILNKAYYIIDADRSGYITYPDQSSSNPEYAPRYIHPHQGFFVKVSTDKTLLKFTNAMRVAGNWNNGSLLEHSNFRDGKLNYPLVNLICYDGNGKRDLTTVETNRPEVGGAQKMHRLRNGNAILYARFENTDYQALYAPVGTSTVPVRFEVLEDGMFTMTWSTYNGDFHYLHLIDNLTGVDVDCLTASEYKFEGRTTDYLSRFKLVFDVTGIEEHETLEPAEGPASFAFQFGDELVVNGEGMLQLFDLNGRCLLTTQAVGAQSSISLPKVANGLYLLRLTDSKQVRTQKIVVR